MPCIFKNENLIAKKNPWILKWFVWLQNFDFEIEYKPGYLNYLVDMLSREQESPFLGMFSVGSMELNLQKGQKHQKQMKK